MFYNVVEWFMTLTDPNMAQAGLVSVVTGAGACMVWLYVNSGSSDKNIVVSTQSDARGTSSRYEDEEGY